VKPSGIKPRLRQQVAAICYRQGKKGVEFLLVKTRGGRWTFPKGGVEPGLTPAQSAAIEAVEEAGVHGRIEELAFGRYRHSKADHAREHPEVLAHLCEVTSLESPKEPGRYPTWFTADKAKQRLMKRRSAEFAGEFEGLVDRAMLRIRRTSQNTVIVQSTHSIPFHAVSFDPKKVDGLQRVQFEAANDDAPIFLARRFGRPVLQLGPGNPNPQPRSSQR
jgi:8-oxo-dGTP pyrophosphatase MutT (NUDIX family)